MEINETKEIEIRESVVLLNENEKIFAVLHKPTQKKEQEKFPAILICHGFGGQKTGRYRFYVSIAEELAKNNVAVLRLDFRGCGDSEGDFLKMTLKTQVSDAFKGVEFLINHSEIDKTKIGIFGRSLGGVVAIMVANCLEQVKSLALFAPLFDMEQWREKWNFLNNSNFTKEELEKKLVMNGQPIGADFIKSLFDMNLEKELEKLKKVPFLHLQGKKDQLIPLEHVQKYQLSRQKAEAPTQFISLENSDHDCSGDIEERKRAIKEIVDWFLKTLF